MRRRRIVVVVLAATAMLLAPPLWRSDASGVFPLVTLFESRAHPDLPFDRFAAGRLGIIKPTWDHSYRYVAYRYLAGAGFNVAEQKALVSLWNDWLGFGPMPSGAYQWIANRSIDKGTIIRTGEAATEWLDARGRVPGIGESEGIGIYRDAPAEYGFFSFINCNEDAFRTAVRTLSTMIARFGDSSPQVKQWVYAQDQVFDDCSNGEAVFGRNVDAWSKMVDEWRQVRNRVPNLPAPSGGFRGTCRGIRFRSAALKLSAMISKSGALSPRVKQWVEQQDKAFADCSNPPAPWTGRPSPTYADIPDPLTKGAPFEQAQRNYQIAAAEFYSGNFDTAAKMFAAIASDPSSPWRQLAPYLVVRAMIRTATLSAATNDQAMLAQAEARLNGIISAPGDDGVKGAARRLLGFVQTQLHPEQRRQELARAVMVRTSPEVFRQNVSDYIWMLEHPPARFRYYHADDLTNWVGGLGTFGHPSIYIEYDPIGKWKTTSSLPWLVAAMIEVPASDPNVPALLDAAEKITPESPAFPTLTYHVARLLIGQGKTDVARTKLDAILARRDELPVSAVNELKGLRMSVARNLTELLEYAQRTPLGFSDAGYGELLAWKLETPVAAATPAAAKTRALQPPRVQILASKSNLGTGMVSMARKHAFVPVPSAAATATQPEMRALMRRIPFVRVPPLAATATPAPTPDPYRQTLKKLAAGPLFDDDGADVLTGGLPLSVLIQAAHSQTLSPLLRGRVALATFIRAILLGDETSARKLAPLVMDSYPKLKPSIDDWLEAKRRDQRNFAAAFMMLRNPGARFSVEPGAGRITPLDEIDFLRDNWWTSGVGAGQKKQTYPSFLAEAEKKSADEEWQKLSAINAPNFLCAAAIKQAKSYPNDARVSFALHRCIVAVHLGCSNSQGSAFAKAAFVLLHHRYPDSRWAIEDRFWYRGNNCGDASLHPHR